MIKKKTLTKAESSAVLFKTLGDTNRFRTLTLLQKSRRGLGVGSIANTLNMSHSAASHLLAVLLENDLVVGERNGREVTYTLASSTRAKALVRVLQAV